MANMHTLQLAAEDYGANHGGEYAAGVSPGPDGSSLTHLLPGAGQYFVNAFTDKPMEPRLGPPPADAPPGSVWYEPVRDSTNRVVSYVISGFGRHGRLYLKLTSGQ